VTPAWSHAVTLVALVATGCEQVAPPSPPPRVAVATPLSREIVEWDEYTGRLEATEYVEVRARVDGYLQSVHFRDGQIVEPDALLFVIDPRPYQAEVDGARAEVERQLARVELARSEARRAERLVARRAISREELDSRTTGLHDAEASLEAAVAALDRARLDLEFTEIRAPIRGRVSRDFVNVGNLVNGGTAQSTVLTTIVSLDPIHVYFEVDERSALKYTELARQGERPTSRDVANPVMMALADEEGFPHRGRMDFVDNRLDPSTGTIRGRAILPNPDLKLTPGLFGRVRLLGSGRYRALLLPDHAIATDQSERLVFVVDGQNQVVRKPIEPGPLVDGFRVVRKGVDAADRVAISGLQRLRPGAVVEPEETSIEAPAELPSLAVLREFEAGDGSGQAAPAP